MWKILLTVMLAISTSCATTSTTETTYVAPRTEEMGQTGRVESVREVIARVDGDPAAGALLGAVIGGILTRGRPIGVIGGAAVGAAASQGSSERRVYDVRVRFDDGVYGDFRYYGYSPFAPGARVVMTPEGLRAL